MKKIYASITSAFLKLNEYNKPIIYLDLKLPNIGAETLILNMSNAEDVKKFAKIMNYAGTKEFNHLTKKVISCFLSNSNELLALGKPTLPYGLFIIKEPIFKEISYFELIQKYEKK